MKPICPADVGPGLAQPEISQFARLTAGEVTVTDSSDHPLLSVLVGTLEDGTGEAFVDALFSRLGSEARGGTVTLEGRIVQHINLLPGGPTGYAYGQGQTVVVGYVRQRPQETPSMTDAAGRGAYAQVLAAATGAPIPDFDPVGSLEAWPLARGRYTTPTDPGWIFFRQPTKSDDAPGYGCGIAPNGTLAGCDYVPDAAPEGTNQMIVDGSGARYVHSDTPTFTRDVDILREVQRLENGPAVCGVSWQVAVQCQIGGHGFNTFGVLH